MSKLQDIARARNSLKGRIKGLRNNARGILKEDKYREALSEEELDQLRIIEDDLSEMLGNWDYYYEKIKNNL